MATTIKQSFMEMKEDLEISGLQRSTVATRQKAVRRVVEAKLGVLDSFLTGSYSRNTMIAPLKEADIDIFIVLNAKYFHHYNNQNGGQAGLLDLVKRTLRRTYTRTPDISRSGQAVTVRFQDFMVDVVPGFHRKGGGYLIPNAVAQTWIATDPKKHVALISDANTLHDDDFIPLLKMIKGWNKIRGGFFHSFHLEVLALQILSGVRISDFPSGVRYVFDKARVLIAKQNLDPAGYGGDVGRYIDSREKIQEAVRKFQLAYDRAIKAEKYERQGYTAHAVNMWVKVFGDYFPRYG